MRIGIDGRLWNETGVGRYIRNLVMYLGEIDRENEYVLFVRNKDLEEVRSEKSEVRNWKVIPADVRWHTIEEQLRLPAILDKEELDLVHFPYFSVPIFYKGKFVVTIHDLIIHHLDTGRATTLPLPFHKAKRLGYKLVMRQVARRASKIIAVSNSTKDEIVNHLKVDPDKVEVTYEGVDEQIRNPKSEIRNKFKIQNSKFKNYFLYVGNAYPHKNLERLIEAFNNLMNDSKFMIQDLNLILVGKEDYFYRRLKDKVDQMRLSEHIIFYGQASDKELSALYQNAKALIMPSLMEGFGLPALEAMASGCLVLASDIAALRELCAEAAIYFNPYDVDDIKKKMELVCSDDLDQWSKKVAIGIERAKHFSWKKMAEETLRIYSTLLEITDIQEDIVQPGYIDSLYKELEVVRKGKGITHKDLVKKLKL